MVCTGHVHRNLANRSASTSLCRPLFCWLLRSDMYVLCFATWLLFCVRLWQIAVGLLYLFQSVCLCYWLQLAYYTYFCMSLCLTAVDLLYLFLCVSVTDCSWPNISVCLCDRLQLTFYTYFCVSQWHCIWPTIPISVCLCDWLQLAPVQGFPIPEIDSKSQQFLSKHRLELLDKKRLLQQVQQNPWSLLLL